MRYFTVNTQLFTGTKSVTIDERCNAFTLYNNGTSKVLFNGMPILPNGSAEVKGDKDEYWAGRVDIQFDGTGVTNPVNAVYITQKIAVDPPTRTFLKPIPVKRVPYKTIR